MSITAVLFIIAIGLFLHFYRCRRRQMQVFKQIGIEGPAPHFLFGNLLKLLNKTFYSTLMEWTKQFGKTYGYFEGPNPVLVTSDVNILQQVFVKQFHNFHARKVWPVQVDPDKDPYVHMFFARGQRWKRLRSIINPAFSQKRLREMSPEIHKCIEKLITLVNTHANTGEEMDMQDSFQRLTMDSIAACGFGLKTNAIQNKNDVFLRHARQVLLDQTKQQILVALGFLFPTLHTLWIRIYNFLGYFQFNPVFWLEEVFDKVLNAEKRLPTETRANLVRLMLNAEYTEPDNTDKELSMKDTDENGNIIRKPTESVKTRHLTTQEIRAQCLLFLLAGYETTSTTLSYILYELANNLTVQRRLYDEIKQHIGEDGVPTLDDIKHMEYLDMVCCETLRKYPMASVVMARQCMQSCVVEGISVPKGMVVQADVWSLHRDENLWGSNTEVFDPERFEQKRRRRRHPLAWMPFGGGPRTCVGLRFAMLEAKLTVARLIQKFEFLPTERSKHPLELVEGATVMPKDGISLKAVQR